MMMECLSLIILAVFLEKRCSIFWAVPLKDIRYLGEVTFSLREPPIEVLLMSCIELNILSRDPNTHLYTKNKSAFPPSLIRFTETALTR